jgi:signal transduction histidine kinase
MKSNTRKKLRDEKLTKANLLISQFINSCSHSMRGPLKSITGLLSLLNKENSECIRETSLVLHLIEDSVEKMETMLTQLEYFLENSNRRLEHQRLVNCEKTLNLILRKYEHEIKAARLTLNVTIDNSVPIYTDIPRLRLIIEHLLQNSIQYCDESAEKPELHICIKASSQNFSIVFTDNGIGIDPIHHLKVFELFYRASEKSSGSGMGLYIVKEIIDKMGGEISVGGHPGFGSIFTITIPNKISAYTSALGTKSSSKKRFEVEASNEFIKQH